MRIMPSGNGGNDWVPQEMGLTKTASNKDGKVQEVDYKDELFQAAKKVVAGLDCCQQGFGGDELANEFTNEVADEIAGDEVTSDIDAVEFEGDVNEVAEEAEEAEAVVLLEDAKEAIEEAVECLQEAEEIENGEDEFEVEVDLDVDDEEVDDDDDDDDDDDEVVEGGVGCGATNEDVGDENAEVVASSDDWVKIAKINPRTRKKITDYWANQLGYPKDFVKLMVKDYEK